MCDDDVGWLHIAMNDSRSMRGSEGASELRCNGDRFRYFQSSFPRFVLEGFAIVPRHRDELSSVIRFADLIHNADVWMIERRCGPCLGKQLRASSGVRRVAAREKFKCDRPAKAGVARLVDHAHAPATNPLYELVM